LSPPTPLLTHLRQGGEASHRTSRTPEGPLVRQPKAFADVPTEPYGLHCLPPPDAARAPLDHNLCA
jgi:hypothetical protein